MFLTKVNLLKEDFYEKTNDSCSRSNVGINNGWM